jgi:hypothetical protein
MTRVLIQHDEAERDDHLSVTTYSRNGRQQGPTRTVKAGREERFELPEGGRLSVKPAPGQVHR